MEECFDLGYHGVVVSDSAACRDRTEARQVRGGTSYEFRGEHSTALVSHSADTRGPHGRPPRGQTRPVAFVRGGLAEKVGFVSNTPFSPRVRADGFQAAARFR